MAKMVHEISFSFFKAAPSYSPRTRSGTGNSLAVNWFFIKYSFHEIFGKHFAVKSEEASAAVQSDLEAGEQTNRAFSEST